ncbi:NAD(P)-dependent oxidoreductase [Litorilinea aerophila]|uniref:NAD(P)-dependent oxidoreductase n=1 Tax=Litorilinea aerophila TaxID=1204385 RepID=A0A540VA70_9CHLR|nr:NAD(P)-dependent oxidoreductase [Litorilinea aerophila]MCC9078524.1 NAD(P)-dependent oxidoreductase [Litorilinea aerophila]
MRKVLLTGAGGRIGSSFRAYADDRYDFRLVDVRPEKVGDPGRHEFVAADLADLEACQRLCAGIDTVLHLAADPSPQADFYASLLDNNVKAVYNIFRAAKDQGCRRVIFASSIQAIEGYPLDVQARPEMPPKPMNMYAVCKIFGEATAHYFAYAEGLSSIAVRVGGYGGNRTIQDPDARTLSAYVSPRDLNHLFVQCIETPDVQFAILQAVSDNRFKRMDITATRELVGYRPQDDAFRLFGIQIPYRDRWFQEWNRGGKEAS